MGRDATGRCRQAGLGRYGQSARFMRSGLLFLTLPTMADTCQASIAPTYDFIAAAARSDVLRIHSSDCG
jgi:hypothetical protein